MRTDELLIVQKTLKWLVEPTKPVDLKGSNYFGFEASECGVCGGEMQLKDAHAGEQTARLYCQDCVRYRS